MAKNINGVILAGGINSRLNNVIKANIEIGGVSVIHRILDCISDIFTDIIVITNTPDEFRMLRGVRFAGDTYLKTGPLGGIHSAVKNSSGDAVFVFAGDMPFIDKKIIMRMIDYFDRVNCDILIPKTGEDIEPLHAIYSTSVLDSLEKYLEENNNTAVREFIKTMNVEYLEITNEEISIYPFFNINSPADRIYADEIILKKNL
jgi:molybdopterin-guanine dinucleotide biosynthesis protein A